MPFAGHQQDVVVKGFGCVEHVQQPSEQIAQETECDPKRSQKDSQPPSHWADVRLVVHPAEQKGCQGAPNRALTANGLDIVFRQQLFGAVFRKSSIVLGAAVEMKNEGRGKDQPTSGPENSAYFHQATFRIGHVFQYLGAQKASKVSSAKGSGPSGARTWSTPGAVVTSTPV